MCADESEREREREKKREREKESERERENYVKILFVFVFASTRALLFYYLYYALSRCLLSLSHTLINIRSLVKLERKTYERTRNEFRLCNKYAALARQNLPIPTVFNLFNS